jgi:hypothetical protein
MGVTVVSDVVDESWRRAWESAFQIYRVTGDREYFNRVICACKEAYGLRTHPEFTLPWLCT